LERFETVLIKNC